MSSSFLHLVVGSRDLSQAEKEITVCKADEIHKMKAQNCCASEESCHSE